MKIVLIVLGILLSPVVLICAILILLGVAIGVYYLVTLVPVYLINAVYQFVVNISCGIRNLLSRNKNRKDK